MPNPLNVYVPPEGPPQGITPSSLIYEKMGADNIYKMLEDFYQKLAYSSIKGMFPTDFIEASKRSADFFISILGGPPIYHQKYGHPRLRQRHMPFAIDEAARRVWFECFKETLVDAEKKYLFPTEHLEEFIHYLDKFSRWMVNTEKKCPFS